MIPGKRPKLIATDLDGTIVPHLGQISDRTIAAFKKAHELGIEIFYITGRPPRWMNEVRDAFGFGNAICANGAIFFVASARTLARNSPYSSPNKDSMC